jgi:predicted GNAT family N-acyltransferase
MAASAGFVVSVANWPDEEAAIRLVREHVFVHEQNVPADLEWDGRDAACVQVLARSRAGDPVGTARMMEDGRIGRMAVLAGWRGRGIGRAMLELLIDFARRRGLRRVHLASQAHAIGFYAASGFVAEGAEFMEAGIPHRHMTLDL